jgi:hypothetical protein
MPHSNTSHISSTLIWKKKLHDLEQIMKLLTVYLSSAFRRFFFLGPEYSDQHPILEYPHSMVLHSRDRQVFFP